MRKSIFRTALVVGMITAFASFASAGMMTKPCPKPAPAPAPMPAPGSMM